MLSIIIKVIITIFSLSLLAYCWESAKNYPWDDGLTAKLFEIGQRCVVVLIFCCVAGGMWFQT